MGCPHETFPWKSFVGTSRHAHLQINPIRICRSFGALRVAAECSSAWLPVRRCFKQFVACFWPVFCLHSLKFADLPRFKTWVAMTDDSDGPLDATTLAEFVAPWRPCVFLLNFDLPKENVKRV